MKENLKPYVYNTWKDHGVDLVHAGSTACLLENEPASYGGWQG